MEKKKAGEAFEQLEQIVEKLRSKEGCPWDKAQTMESLRSCMVHELTEAIAAITIYQETADAQNLCEELGDCLLQIMLLSQMAKEQGQFTAADVIETITQKMIRRHPHVFGDQPEICKEEVPGQWEKIKAQEKKDVSREEQQRENRAKQEARHYIQTILSAVTD